MLSLSIPLYLRIGSGADFEIGTLSLPFNGDGTVTLHRANIAAALRDAADAFEHPTGQNEGVPDAAAHG